MLLMNRKTLEKLCAKRNAGKTKRLNGFPAEVFISYWLWQVGCVPGHRSDLFPDLLLRDICLLKNKLCLVFRKLNGFNFFRMEDKKIKKYGEKKIDYFINKRARKKLMH